MLIILNLLFQIFNNFININKVSKLTEIEKNVYLNEINSYIDHFSFEKRSDSNGILRKLNNRT